ncbi:MAG TPA: hypothetical protein VF230_15715 [Acidimicrobiales bacterium]
MTAGAVASTALRGLTLTRRVGAGGEAEVFEVAERPGLVCKHYRNPTRDRAEKLRVMLANPPDGMRAGGHVSIAWPTELVLGDGGDVTGFLMPRIDVRSAIPVFQVYNPQSRVAVAPGFSWRYLLRTARNVAAIVDAVHRAGHVVGDLNESNLLVDRRALVALVDCDSMQVTDPTTGRIHHSPVGKPEFLAPELHGHDLSTADRTPQSDAFALTVLIHQLLLEGVHPHSGIWRGRGDPPDVTARIRRGWWAGKRGWSPVDRPPHALPLATLPLDLQRLVRRGLSRRPSARPDAWEWVAVLEALDARLATCARIDRGLPDPFPGPAGVSVVARRPPPRWRVLRARARRAVAGAASVAARRTKPVPVAAAAAIAGFAWPVVSAAAVALVVVPVVFAIATPAGPRRLFAASKASAAAFVACGPMALAIAWGFVSLPLAARVASAVTALATGVALPAVVPAWAPARARLARVPVVVWWAALGGVVAAARAHSL